MVTVTMLKVLIVVVLSLSLQASAFPRRGHRHGRAPRGKGSNSFPDHLLKGAGCSMLTPPYVKAPRSNVWTADKSTLDGVFHWVRNHTQFNVYEAMVEFMRPNKSDVLPYLDGYAAAPEQYASVAVHNKTDGHPALSNILVGPLPLSNRTTWQPLWYPFTRKTPIRYLEGGANYTAYDHWYKNITRSVADILPSLWNATALGKSNQTIRPYRIPGQYPIWQYDDKITEWAEYWNGASTGDFDAGDLLPLGLYVGSEFDLYLSDPSTWKFKGWVYNNIFYPTTEAFRKAFFSPDFEKLGANTFGPWCSTDQTGPVMHLDDEAPPMPIGARKARFSVDPKENYIEWMDFSFFLVQDYYGGMTLFDVRFKGERIIYEIGIQEIIAHYAGIDPVQSGTAYLDGTFGFGADAVELMPGYDCPTYATYLNASFDSYSTPNALCLFEFDADYPIQRHAYSSNTKNIYFVMRTVNTIGNYDYMFTYEFYLDGSIQIVLRAAGYIQSSYYAKNHDYGYHIHDFLSGGMHDHVFNFKADFDILGTNNTMELVTVTPVTENYVWSDQPRNTMKLVRSEVTSEDESKLMWASNGATQYRIVNKDKPNKYGEYRGYRIQPSQGTIHLTIHNSSDLANAGNFALYDLSITKQKDTEPKSANPLNDNDIYNPMVDFNKFFDGDNLEQEDLVLWFNMGVHHIPHTGDLPNTVYTTAHTAVQIVPSNYWSHDQSRDTVNMVRLDYHPNNKVSPISVFTFGQAQQVCMADLSNLGYDSYK